MKKIIALYTLFTIVTSALSQPQWNDVTSFNQVISGLHSYNNQLHITGGFTDREGSTCYWSSYYSGASFTDQSTLIGGTGLRQLEVFNGELYATGTLQISSSTGVFKWDGSTWQAEGYFNTSHSGIYADNDTLYAGSDFGKIKRKPVSGSWTTMPVLDDTTDNIQAITKYNGDIIIAGAIDSYNSTALNNIARWDGSAWQPLGSGLSDAVNALAIFNGDLYAGGVFNNAGGNSAKFIAKWDGSSWTDVGGSMTGSGYNGVKDMKVHNNMLYVVGDFDQMGSVTTKYVAAWDGSNWNTMDLSVSSSYGNCIEVYNNKLYVGTFDFSDAHLYSTNLGSTGYKENSVQTTFSIFPNPSNDKVSVATNTSEKSISIEVYNTTGKKILQKRTKEATAKVVLNCSDWNSGMYIFLIRNAETGAILSKEPFVKN